MANDCIPFYENPGAERLTGHCDVAVIGKRFIKNNGGRQAGGSPGLSGVPQGTGTGGEGGNYRIAPAAAGGPVFGVALYDGPIGSKVAFIKGTGVVLPVTSGAAIAADEQVESDATGRAITLASGVAVGRCRQAVGAADLDAEIQLY